MSKKHFVFMAEHIAEMERLGFEEHARGAYMLALALAAEFGTNFDRQKFDTYILREMAP